MRDQVGDCLGLARYGRPDQDIAFALGCGDDRCELRRVRRHWDKGLCGFGDLVELTGLAEVDAIREALLGLVNQVIDDLAFNQSASVLVEVALDEELGEREHAQASIFDDLPTAHRTNLFADKLKD